MMADWLRSACSLPCVLLGTSLRPEIPRPLNAFRVRPERRTRTRSPLLHRAWSGSLERTRTGPVLGYSQYSGSRAGSSSTASIRWSATMRSIASALAPIRGEVRIDIVGDAPGTVRRPDEGGIRRVAIRPPRRVVAIPVCVVRQRAAEQPVDAIGDRKVGRRVDGGGAPPFPQAEVALVWCGRVSRQNLQCHGDLILLRQCVLIEIDVTRLLSRKARIGDEPHPRIARISDWAATCQSVPRKSLLDEPIGGRCIVAQFEAHPAIIRSSTRTPTSWVHGPSGGGIRLMQLPELSMIGDSGTVPVAKPFCPSRTGPKVWIPPPL